MKMQITKLVLTTCLILCAATPVQAATFTVNSTVDRVDATPGDGLCETARGLCTLRAAVMEANADATADTINLAAGVYRITLAGTNEDASRTGDFDITSPVTIVGSDSTSGQPPIINGMSRDRVFDLHANADGSSLSNMRIKNGFIHSSTNDTLGGAILIDSADNVTISEVAFIANSAEVSSGWSGLGGALAALSSTDLTVSDSTFIGNNAEYGDGGALYLYDSSGTVSNTLISGNFAEHDGGGVWLNDAFTFDNVVIKENTAENGGGIYTRYAGDSTITNSEISANTATYSGGGMYVHYCSASTTTIVNSTFSGNAATAYFGGGIYLGSTFDYHCSASIYSSTIVNNQAGYSGGGIYNTSTDLTMGNSILALNSATVNYADCSSGNTSSDGYNLVGDTDGCVYTSSSGDITGSASAGTTVDPLIDTLANNGGTTQTHALQVSSPAIDAGNPAGCLDDSGATLTNDQRGSAYSRTADGDSDGTATCDIGAYEVQ